MEERCKVYDGGVEFDIVRNNSYRRGVVKRGPYGPYIAVAYRLANAALTEFEAARCEHRHLKMGPAERCSFKVMSKVRAEDRRKRDEAREKGARNAR
jgi:hypothetical protein